MNIYFSKSKVHGFGVFANCEFKKNDTISIDPIILIPKNELKYLDKTILSKYYFDFGDDGAICLGFGSLYNHSYTANATFKILLDKKSIKFIAVKDICRDEEIFINYNQNPNSKIPLETWWDKSYKSF